MTVLAHPRRYVIAFSHAVSELLVVQAVRAYADRRAGEIDGVELLHGNTRGGDLAQQRSEVAGWIERGVDAIVVMPIDAAALQPLVERAHATGIRVLSYAFPLPDSDGEVGFDSVLSGQLCGAAAAAFIRERFPHGGAQALVGALAATPLFAPRWLEPIAAIEAAGGTVVVIGEGATVETGRTVTEAALRTHPDLSIVVGINDEFAVGAAQAFEAAGKDPARSFICGQDGAPEGLREIVRGRHYTGSAAILLDQLGAAIVDMSIAAIEGRPATVRVPAEYVSLADPARVTTLLAAFDTITG
ncbi:MAG: sugar ABC transporter substrate-binding protein [Gemmatimonadota bacterium]|nr:sugar ABC transporter substrate-binding protein [Gemmatimonadota bacterium]